MIFADHSKLKDQHAFLSASNYSWLNYDEEKVADAYVKHLAKQRGTVLHAFAKDCITLGQKLPRSNKTLNQYVNDAIGYKMTPEQILYFSENCFGTADAIAFRNKFLRIHDLKTGFTPAKMDQLMIYAALFCLEYNWKPEEIQTELRIYQMDEVHVFVPSPEEIREVIKKIISFDKVIESVKSEEV